MDDPTPGALVQRFSWEMENSPHSPDETESYQQLRNDVKEDRERRSRQREAEIERIQAIFSARRPEDLALFQKTKTKLMETMRKFQEHVPANMRKTEIPSSWADVDQAVQAVHAEWEAKRDASRFSRAKEWMRKMAQGLNNHSTALKMLPSESEYVSLVSGAVTMIIQAAGNYTLITESFAMGIVTINDAVSLATRSGVYESPLIQQAAMRLYSHIFQYLIHFMTWYGDRSRTRFLKSFNEDLNRIFDTDLTAVKEASQYLATQIHLHMSADVRTSKLMQEDMSSSMRYLVQLQEAHERDLNSRHVAQAEFFETVVSQYYQKTRQDMEQALQMLVEKIPERLRQDISANSITNLLEQQASREVPSLRTLAAPYQSDSFPAISTRAAFPGTPVAMRRLSREPLSVDSEPQVPQRGTDIKLASSHFEDYFSWDRVYPFTEIKRPLMADAVFVNSLKQFTTTMESQIMYVHSRYHVGGQNQLQQSVAEYITMAREARIPVISYFCEPTTDELPPGRSAQSMELCALIYSLIRQVIQLLPAELLPTAPFLDPEMFGMLDGTLRTWEEALKLLGDLIRCVDLPLLLFVIDGVNTLEDEEGSRVDMSLRQLICCLEAQTRSPLPNDRMIKVLFSTAGVSEALCQELDERNIVASSVSASNTPRKNRGRQALLFG